MLFSIFCSLTVAISYHLSRGSGDPTVAMSILKRHFLQLVSEESPGASSSSLATPPSPGDDGGDGGGGGEEAAAPGGGGGTGHSQDPLPKKLRSTVNARLKNDAIVCCLSAVVVFLVHQSDSFAKGHPKLDVVLWSIAGITGGGTKEFAF